MWLLRQIGQRLTLAFSVDELGPINFRHNFDGASSLHLNQIWGDWQAESEKDVLSLRRLTHWTDPANSAFNLGPTQLVLNMDPFTQIYSKVSRFRLESRFCVQRALHCSSWGTSASIP